MIPSFLMMLVLAHPMTSMGVFVLPLETPQSQEAVGDQMTQELRQVLGSMKGILHIEKDVFDNINLGEARKTYYRCGRDRDCQYKIGNLVGANVVIIGTVEKLGKGIKLDLVLLEVGRQEILGKVSKSLWGSTEARKLSLEVALTEMLMPQQLVGTMDLFLDPPGGTVWVDGKMVIQKAGEHFHWSDIKVGQHTVRVAREGYADFYAIVQVPFREAVKLQVKMRPL